MLNATDLGNSCIALPPNLQSGLAGYWPFCGSAIDESGNGNDGTVNGATLAIDRFGNDNCTYDFDGIDDNIVFGTSTGLNPSNQISISLWVNLDTVSYTHLTLPTICSV